MEPSAPACEHKTAGAEDIVHRQQDDTGEIAPQLRRRLQLPSAGLMLARSERVLLRARQTERVRPHQSRDGRQRRLEGALHGENAVARADGVGARL